MTPQEVIESGLLEAYAMGQCTPAEQQLVQDVLHHPHVQAQLHAIEDTLAALAEAGAQEPPAHLRTKVLRTIAQEALPKTPTPSPEATTHAAPAPARSNATRTWAITASLLAACLAIVAIIQYNQASLLRQQATNLQAELQTLRNESQLMATTTQNLQQDLAILAHHATHTVPVQGQDLAEGHFAMVYWNSAVKAVYVGEHNLPAPEAGKQYQLWAVSNGQVLDAGMLPLGQQATPSQLKNIDQAEGFVITLESEGGVPVAKGPLVGQGRVTTP